MIKVIKEIHFEPIHGNTYTHITRYYLFGILIYQKTLLPLEERTISEELCKLHSYEY